MTAPATSVAPPLSPRDPRLEPWRAFLQAHARVTRRLDEELRAEHDLSLAEYDTLLAIAWSPDRRIRMRTLADSILLSKSGVTRLIDRLVADGLVERKCVRLRRAWRGGRPDQGRPGSAPRRVAHPPARHRRATSSTPSTTTTWARHRAIDAPSRRPRVPAGVDAVPWRPDRGHRRRRPLSPRADAAVPDIGTSGFAYPGWVPRFYPAGSKAGDLLRRYAERLTAVELNNTFYQQPSAAKVAAWLAATPPAFRFSVKAQRGGSWRAMAPDRPRRPAARNRACPG